MHTFLVVVGLGLAGIDPFAAIALLAAIIAGVSRRKALVFFFSMLLFTLCVGVALSIGGEAVMRTLTTYLPSDSSPVWLYVNLGIIALLLTWLLYRWYRDFHPRSGRTDKPKRRLTGTVWSFAAGGIVYSFIGALSDPTFYATIAVTAQTGNIFAVAGLQLLWFVLGQCMLVVLVVGFLFGAHKNIVKKSQLFWQKYKHYMPVALRIVAGLLIIIFTVDTVVFLIKGVYLF